MYLDDCVEIFFMSGDDEAHQFIVNAAGQLWDAIRKIGAPIDASWNCPGIQVASRIDGDKITLEVAIPMAEIGLKRGDRVRANFYRSRVVDENQQFAAWSPVFVDDHLTPERFGTLVIE